MINAIKLMRSGLLLASFSALLVHAALAQAINEKIDWKGRTFSESDNNISPCDSLTSAMAFSWTATDTTMTKTFQAALAKLYPQVINVERILSENKLIQRYIINDGGRQIEVLEKVQHSGCIIFYLRNGIPEHEMRFYKLLTAYYVE